MANEIAVTVNLQAAKAGGSAFSVASFAKDMAGTDFTTITQTITGSALAVTSAVLNIGNVVLGGFLSIKNQSTTETVLLGRFISSVYYPTIAIGPLETVIIRTVSATYNSSALYVSATNGVATTQIQTVIISN